MILGVICGIFAAFFQDLSFSLGRGYVKSTNNPQKLFIHTQIIMGVISIPILLFTIPFIQFKSWSFITPLACTIIGANLGQYFFLQAEKYIVAEKVASLMGLRLVSLSIVSALFLGDKYSFIQWSSIFLASFAAFLMNYEDSKFNSRGFFIFLLSIASYTLSDLNVENLVHEFNSSSLLLNSFIALAMVNIISAIILASINKIDWKLSEFTPILPYTASWLFKQIAIYMTYGLIGAVHGNVVLSIRGPLAMGLAYILAKLHLNSETEKSSKRLWTQRIIASSIMMIAIILYTINKI